MSGMSEMSEMSETKSKIKEAILDFFFPPRCAWCARVGVKGACPECEKALPRHKHPMHYGALYGRCVTPFVYRDIVRDGILRYKFRGAQLSAKVFGREMARCAERWYGGEFDLITWVPTSPRRKEERGFDQSELLAREMANQWQREAIQLLRKIRDNAVQSRLSSADERRANVLGVYEPTDAAAIRGKRILLVDDILTTGSTMGECARTLYEVGAAEVMCIALAAREHEKEGEKEEKKGREDEDEKW